MRIRLLYATLWLYSRFGWDCTSILQSLIDAGAPDWCFRFRSGRFRISGPLHTHLPQTRIWSNT